MTAELLVLKGRSVGAKYFVESSAVINRGANRTQSKEGELLIFIDDPKISRSHARITEEGGLYFVEDLGSLNRTHVNGEEIRSKTRLLNGSRIRVGNTVLLFKSGLTPPAEAEDDDESASDAARDSTTQIEAATPVDRYALLREEPPPSKDDAHKLNRVLRAMCRISEALRAAISLERLFSLSMDALFDAFTSAERGIIALCGEGEDELSVLFHKTRRNEYQPLDLSLTIAREAMESKKALLCCDAVGEYSASESVKELNLRSVMCAPLVTKDRSLGVVEIDTLRETGQFSEDDLDLFGAVVTEIALAIENSKMYRERLAQEKIKQDLKNAKQVIGSFLPEATLNLAACDFRVCYRPALYGGIGGDFYDLMDLPENRVGIAVGDVAGKGMEAAVLMARASAYLRAFARVEREPKDVLQKMNETLAEEIPEDRFISLIYACLDAKEGNLKVANAGHCPLMIRRSKPNDTIQYIASDSCLLGILPGMSFFQTEVSVEPGDVLIFFTDGVTDATSPTDRRFGSKRLEKAARRDASSVDDVFGNIMRDLDRFVGRGTQVDDIVLLCFRPFSREAASPCSE